MAHFAKIGLNSKVIEVVIVNNQVLLDADGNENEINGVNFLTQLTGWAIWKQTSFNTKGGVHNDSDGTPIRKNYAAIGHVYDEDKDAFYEPQPFPSWTLNNNTCIWEPPVSKLTDDSNTIFIWNEESQSWDSDSL